MKSTLGDTLLSLWYIRLEQLMLTTNWTNPKMTSSKTKTFTRYTRIAQLYMQSENVIALTSPFHCGCWGLSTCMGTRYFQSNSFLSELIQRVTILWLVIFCSLWRMCARRLTRYSSQWLTAPYSNRLLRSTLPLSHFRPCRTWRGLCVRNSVSAARMWKVLWSNINQVVPHKTVSEMFVTF